MMNKIDQALTTWDNKKDVAEFIKERLGLQGTSGKNHAEEIIDNAIERAKVEERPEWTNILLNNIKEDKKAATPQTNIFMNANAVTDETLNKLVNVTPRKTVTTKIEELI